MENKHEYLVQYEHIKHFENNNLMLKELIKKTPGLPIKDLKLKDLVFCNGEPIYRGVGVYVFKSSEQCYYVGSCIARNFVERIPGHFDIRHSGWFNSLLKAIIKRDKKTKSDENLTEAALYAFKNLSLILINFDAREDININARITNLERRLGSKDCLSPLNSRFLKLKEIVEIPTK